MNKLKSKAWFPYFMLVLGMFCIGLSPIFIRLANISGTVISFYRSAIAGTILLIILFYKGNFKINKQGIILACLAGAFFAIDLVFWSISLFYTNAATSTLLANLAPIWVGFGALFILKERLNKFYWYGLVITLLGVLTIMGLTNISHFKMGYGNSLAIIASFFYAGYLLATQKSRTFVSTLTFTALAVVSCAILLFILCIFKGEILTGFSLESWIYILALGIVSHLIGWLSINYALGHIKASIASVTLLGQPVVAAILAIPLLGENLSVGQIIGGFVVLMGIYLVNLKK